MHKDRFDALATGFAATRRGALRFMAGGAMTAVLAQIGLGEAAAACKKNGAKCEKKKDHQCCSGTCRNKGTKANKNFRCVKLESALGCTNEKKNDLCQGNNVNCPKGGVDTLCFVDEKGRPGCADTGESLCFDCADDADCVAETLEPEAKCVKGCAACVNDNSRFCAVPAVPN
ncbi:MAG: hypothetical protein H0V24_05880 [Chloroflexia bacterium]|nr:hypothetical protein [Chloroflexia bacterium]MDQ3410948.1 hypothetical protein [Chloroflexota bacterium]